MVKDTKNFNVSEFACHCGCGYNVIDQRVINMAQAIRDELGVPVHVNSGCRCRKRNKAVGGVTGKPPLYEGESFHVKGKACDLSCCLGAIKMFEAVKKLKYEGKLPDLEYCILYKGKNFIHIDCGGKRKSLWEVRR